MTTALIGKQGAARAKARVAVVSRRGLAGLSAAIARSGHEVLEVQAWEELSSLGADLVLCDDETVGAAPAGLEVPAVLVSDRTPSSGGFGTVSPASLEAVLDTFLGFAAELGQRVRRAGELEALFAGVKTGEALVGKSPVVRRLHGVIARAADSDATVLIEGPAGSGKSLVARIIHCKSRRATKPLGTLDCPTTEAEALSAAIDQCRNTTLLLEDIDRLPSAAQSVLVRHLKDRTTGRGDGAPRLIATTAAHLPELVARGAFREDLYYRLHAFPMVVPALRERQEDIVPIAEAILAIGAASTGRVLPALSPSARTLLESTPWPGNVAQLEVVLRRAQAQAAGPVIDRDHLLAAAPAPGAAPVAAPAAGATGEDSETELTEDSILPFDEEEQRLLSRALRATKGNVRRAAQLLGIGRATLYRKIQQYKLRLQ